MSADCNGCGACCDPVVNTVSPAELYDGTVDRSDHVYAVWMRKHLTPLPRRDITKLVPWFQGGGWSQGIIQGEARVLPSFAWRCDLFDPVARRCTDYDNRPPVCRDYPWYGDGPDPQKALPPTCSYRADAGLAVTEMPVEWRQR